MSDPHATLDYALNLMERGLSIIPVNTSGPRVKKPHFHALHGTGYSYQEVRRGRLVNIPSWKEFQEKRATADEIMAWVMKFRVTGFAMVTGSISGIVGLDFDVEGLGTLDALGWVPHVRTPSGGAHVYVKHPGFKVRTVKASGMKNEAMRLPSGLDVRGDGGYILLPPAYIEGKGRYVRTAEKRFLSISDIPEDFMDGHRLCHLREVLGLAPPKAPPTPLFVPLPTLGDPQHSDALPPTDAIFNRAVDKAINGSGRNEAGFWFACQMRDNGYAQRECEMFYASLSSAFPPCDAQGEFSPYTEREFMDSVRSAYRRQARPPWRPPIRSGQFSYNQ